MVIASGTVFGSMIPGGDGQLSTPGKMTITTRQGQASITIEATASAQQAIAIVVEVITDVDIQRSMPGAVQNRLEHTIFNLQSIRENVTNSRSRIKDTDYASEMAEMTKQQILKKAGIANLAQANEMARDVLLLIR